MFDEIKKKYPKAWKKYVDWHSGKSSMIPYLNEEVNSEEKFIENMFFEYLSGWLFRFFDEEGIHISIHYSGVEYYYQYWMDGNLLETSDDTFKSRDEAEKAAFEKAFEILEKR